MNTSLPFNLDTWLNTFLPWIQNILSIDNDDKEVVRYWYDYGLRSRPLKLKNVIKKRKVICFGAGPNLIKSDSILPNIDQSKIALCAADGATRWFLEHNIMPDFVVTDLDGITFDQFLELLNSDVCIQILTHGDNYDKIEDISDVILAGNYRNVYFSTQGEPILGWENTLGFTDGDRLVAALSPYSVDLFLVGYDLYSDKIGQFSKPEFQKDQPITHIKKIKLEIADTILRWVFNKEPFYIEDNKFGPGIEHNLSEFISIR